MSRALRPLVVAALAGFAACSEEASAPPPPIRVGTLTSVSGDLASLGLEFTDATSLALADINAAGGVLGRPLDLVVEDDGTSPEGAKAGLPKLLAAKVPVVLGPTTSGQVVEIVDLIGSGGTLTIGRTTTADQLSDLADNGYFFRLAPADAYQADLLVSLIREANLEHLCLVHRRDVYGNNLARRVQQKLQAGGPAVNVVESDYNASSSDLSGVIGRCDALVCPPGGAGDAGGGGGAPCTAPPPAKVGLMLITFIEDGALILDDAQRKGWSASKQRFYFSDGVYDRGILTRVKDVGNLEGALGTAPSGPDPARPEGEQLRKFVARYKDRYGREPSIFVENAYDAMYVAAIAMEISGSAAPGPAVRDAVAKVSVPGGKKVYAGDWAGIRAAIRAGTPIDFDGASGPVEFDAKGDIKPPYYYVVWKVEGGTLTVARRTVVTP